MIKPTSDDNATIILRILDAFSEVIVHYKQKTTHLKLIKKLKSYT